MFTVSTQIVCRDCKLVHFVYGDPGTIDVKTKQNTINQNKK